MMQNQAVQDKIDSSMKSDMKSLTCDKFIKFLLKLNFNRKISAHRVDYL